MTFGKSTALGLATAVAIGAGVAGMAMANSNENDGDKAEMLAISEASVSLSDAISTAEQHAAGKAEEAGIDNRDNQTFFWEVKVRGADGNIQKVLVDLKTGAVAQAMADDDHEENDDENDDENETDGGVDSDQ